MEYGNLVFPLIKAKGGWHCELVYILYSRASLPRTMFTIKFASSKAKKLKIMTYRESPIGYFPKDDLL
jgi:hypothetical protein